MDDGKKLPLKIDGRKIQANLVLFQSQQYRIYGRRCAGFHNAPIAYELRVKPDGFPTIDLLSPTEDMEINGDEVLTLEYSARDDFGISEVNLVAKVGEHEDKIRLQQDDAKQLIVRDQFKWDLGKLALRDGEEATFIWKPWTTTPSPVPSSASRRSLRLRLKNLKGEHQQVADMIRDTQYPHDGCVG